MDKPLALSLCLALLLPLAACGGEPVTGSILPPAQAALMTPSAPPPSPTPSPAPALSFPLAAQRVEGQAWDHVALSDFPTQPVSPDAAQLWDGGAVYLLEQLAQEDIFLYGLGMERDAQQYPYLQFPEDSWPSPDGLILRLGERWETYPLYYMTPRSILPRLHKADFDGDGADELLILAYTGSGTGISSWTLDLVELDSEPWTVLSLPESSYYALPLSCFYEPATCQGAITLGRERVKFDLSGCAQGTESLECYTGTWIEYEVEGDSIFVDLAVGVVGDGVPYTTTYPARIRAQVVYDGTGFSLLDPSLIPEEVD